jgi:hypothetical protein
VINPALKPNRSNLWRLRRPTKHEISLTGSLAV